MALVTATEAAIDLNDSVWICIEVQLLISDVIASL
jgi:hypothetical protein